MSERASAPWDMNRPCTWTNDDLIGYIQGMISAFTIRKIFDNDRPVAVLREVMIRLESAPHVPTEAEWKDLGRPADYGEQ